MINTPLQAGSDTTKLKLAVGEIRAMQNEFNRKFERSISALFDEIEAIEKRERRFKPASRRAKVVAEALRVVRDYKNKHAQVKVSFYENPDKHTVICVLRSAYTSRCIGRAEAKASHGDVYNEQIGRAIALFKARGLSIPPHFMFAPEQPPILLENTVIQAKHNGKNYRIKYHYPSMDAPGSKAYVLDNASWLAEHQFTVVDDTHAYADMRLL